SHEGADRQGARRVRDVPEGRRQPDTAETAPRGPRPRRQTQGDPREPATRSESRPETALRYCPGGRQRPVPPHEGRYEIPERIVGGKVGRARRSQRRGGGVFELRGGALPTRIPALHSKQATTLPWSWASTSMNFRHFGH